MIFSALSVHVLLPKLDYLLQKPLKWFVRTPLPRQAARELGLDSVNCAAVLLVNRLKSRQVPFILNNFHRSLDI